MTRTVAARAPTGKSRLMPSRKPGSKGAGLGVKKMVGAKVDDSLFDQAPQEEAEVLPDVPAVSRLAKPPATAAAPFLAAGGHS